MEIKLVDNIKKLDMSKRLRNILLKNEVITIEDLLKKENVEIEKLYGLGDKSINELKVIKKNLEEYFEKSYIKLPIDMYSEDDYITFVDENNVIYMDYKITDINLSTRATNALKRNKINYYSELIKLSDEELLNFRNLGMNSLNEIKKLKEEIVLKPIIEFNTEFITEKNINYLSDENKKYLNNIMNILQLNHIDIDLLINDKYIKHLKETKNKIENKDLLKVLCNIDIIQKKYKNIIINAISKTNYGLYMEEIKKLVPELTINKKFHNNIIKNLIINEYLDYTFDERLVIKRKTFKELGKNILNKREFNILKNRIEGKTLEDIGEIYDLSRERIRQIEKRAIKKLDNKEVVFYEDYYRYIFLKYKLSKEDYQSAFGNDEIYTYLSMRNNNANPIFESESILEDSEIPSIIRKKFKKVIYKDHIKINNNRVKKTRQDLMNYVLKTYVKNDKHYNDVKKIYLKLISDLNLSDFQNLGFIDRGYENRLITSNKVLWKHGKMLRYYDQKSYDFTELLKILNLNQYKNVEYSTLKFYRQYRELMIDYDIRDEYELHNLLKKICLKQNYPDIKFKRMPNIEFGVADREKQVKELLYMTAPISNDGFAKEYENEYGVLEQTVLANYVKCIEKYFFNGEYRVDFPNISPKIKNILKSRLSDEIYLIEDVILEAKKIDPNIKNEELNPRSLKDLGFIVYEKYMISNNYDNATHYFNYILTNEDLIDLDKIDFKTKQIASFTAQLYKLKREYEIIEYAPDKYVNFKRLESNNISKEMFIDFKNQVLNFLGEGRYFTMAYLRKQGFSHYLDELGFDDWFYTSLLIENREQISYIRIGKNKVMLTRKYNFNFEEFLENIVYNQETLYIDIYDLNNILKTEYRIYTDIYNLISIIKSSSMYYDEITEKVYADYEIYFEVI